MKYILAGLLCLLPLVPALAGDAAIGMAEVRAMGHLNGEALACKQMALVDRIRMRIIYEAPKTREVGEAFEVATTERFLAMGEGKGSCVDAKDLAERVEQASQKMRAVFAGTMEQKP